MKIILKHNVFAGLAFILVLLFLNVGSFSAEAESNGVSIPLEGILPLGSLVDETPALFDVSAELVNVILNTGNAGLAKVAPGELFPISIELANFGGGKRVDVVLNYAIFSSAEEKIYESSETVAVETTASFIKTIQIPFETAPGIYKARTSITYQGQVVPATTEFPFTVERKIFGLFQSDFFLYAGIILGISILIFFVSRAFMKGPQETRFTPFDYSHVVYDKRIFYEILSDTIMEMRGRVGDKALLIAAGIPGLKIDKENGRVLDLTEHPSKIIATLVGEYEKLLGKKVSFSFRREKVKTNL